MFRKGKALKKITATITKGKHIIIINHVAV
jgi:hypothetical protein